MVKTIAASSMVEIVSLKLFANKMHTLNQSESEFWSHKKHISDQIEKTNINPDF